MPNSRFTKSLPSQHIGSKMCAQFDLYRAGSLFKQISLDQATLTKLAEMDRLILQHEKELCRLKRSRNGLLPAGRLPAEVLARIIGLAWAECARSEPNFLVAVTHICGQWRDVVLDMPTLWSRIGLKNPQHFRGVVQRAGKLPLTVVGHIDRHEEHAVDAAVTALRRLHRIRGLELYMGLRYTKRLAMLKNQEAGKLESLTLSRLYYRDDEGRALSWIQKLSFPRLQALNIRNFQLSTCKALLLPSLRSLSILAESGASSTDSALLLSLLRNLPLLENLELHDAVNRYSEATTQQQLRSREKVHAVKMYHLKHLFLRGELSSSSMLLSNLKLPADANIHVVFDSVPCRTRSYDPYTEFPLAEMLQPLTTLANNISAPGCPKKVVFTTDSGSPSFENVMVWPSPNTQPLGWLKVSVQVWQHSQESQDALDMVVRNLAPAGLQHLQVEARMPSEDWRRRFLHLQNVTRLSVAGADDPFLDAMSAIGDTAPMANSQLDVNTTHAGQDAVLFPHLQSLRLEEDSPELYPAEFSHRLSSMLGSRKAKGSPIGQLDVRGVKEWPELDVALLKEAVDTLTLRPPAVIHLSPATKEILHTDVPQSVTADNDEQDVFERGASEPDDNSEEDEDEDFW
ncbi:hypothetical protein NEOLEDRAFT_724195 [Neolentinus lepideus HHB14362 ss-1]|uniref:Uncharacterized protein n=1 Tax=Neolentinus lepideus HHB14362 ss-1 TaxID=1314782 RepID=A0A165Q3G0_9AGAM|nr:hypothetical protein NEOLEDRAFT_724195 [Neolentinus lepideus HHB14362 ss-1]